MIFDALSRWLSHHPGYAATLMVVATVVLSAVLADLLLGVVG